MSLSRFRFIILVTLLVVVASLLYVQLATPWNHFSAQAQSFLDGRLDIPSRYYHDSTVVNGKTYWPLGPFPSIPLMALVPILGLHYSQGFLHVVLIGLLSFFLYKLAKKKGFSPESSFFSRCGLFCGLNGLSHYY